MCDCFHLAFPKWHDTSSGTGAGRRPRGVEHVTEDDSRCDEPSPITEGERPRPQGSSPVEECPETEKYTDSDKEGEAEHDHKKGKKAKKSGFGSMFDKRSTPKMNKLKEVHSPGSEPGVIVKTAQDGGAEGLIYGGGGREGIFIKEVVPESPASKSLELRQGDQILSATVYFDNVSYEDAIQIMEHAQAYKMKLCLKREPDITQTEPAITSNAIPEEDIYDPEMREQGKTKRRGDTRISWPKFPSFGKGKKSGFTRSHSSSEADEQRNLELSPTTSETESPIKSEDALKGKKKHKKIKVSKSKGRVNSSEEKDRDAQTTGQNSGADIRQTQVASVMLSPDHLGSPSLEKPEVLAVVEDANLRLDKNHQKVTEPHIVQHKVELITIDSTLKTSDLTVVLADQESPSIIKSPDGKKKKKEKSELKMKIFGKDKQKKDAKAKSSPKRLKTIGASIEIPDQPEKEKELQGGQLVLNTNTQIISSESSKVISTKSETTAMKINIPKVELDISEIALKQKSQQKGEEKPKTGSTFKLPKIGFSDVTRDETPQKMNVVKQLTTEGNDSKDDLHDKMSTSSLPKREDIEIPGMEDVPKRTKTKGIKALTAGFMRPNEEIQRETVQMSIDVNSVKEAVSKLPGYKLPKVDMSGVPIPEEITVIDANAQRISVKTPTKVVDSKAKYEAQIVTLQKLEPTDITSEEVLSETKADLKKSEMGYKAKQKQSKKDIKTGLNKLEDIIPVKENIKEVAVHQSQEMEKREAGECIKSEYELTALGSKESEKKSKKTNIVMPSLEIAIPNIGIDLRKQNISGKDTKQILAPSNETEYIDAVPFPEISCKFKDVNADQRTIKLPKFGAVTPDISANIPEADMNINIEGAEIKTLEIEGKGSKFKMPKFGIKVPKAKGPEFDSGLSKKDVDVTQPEAEAQVKTPEASDTDVILGSADEPLQTEDELDGQGSKFKIPKLGIKIPKFKGPEFESSLSKKDVDVTLPEVKAEINLPEASDIDVTLKKKDVSLLEQKPLQTEGELDGQGGKFKMPKFGIKMPKIKGSEFDSSLSKKDLDVPEATTETDFTPGNIDVSITEQKMEVGDELDGQGGKFKMPKFGIKMPKIKGTDSSLSKKDIDIPEVTAEVKFPESHETGVTLGNMDVSITEQKVEDGDELDGQGGRFKMSKFGIKMPKIKGPDSSLSKKDNDVPEVSTEVKFPAAIETDVILENIVVSITEQKMEVGDELDGQGGKFKMPKFGIKMPKIKGPDSSLSKKDMDIPEVTAEVKIPEVHKTDVTVGNIDVSITEQRMEVGDELDGQGGKFKMPKFGIKMPKIKGPDLSSSRKDTDVLDAAAEVKFLEAIENDITQENIDIMKQKTEIGKPQVDIKPQQIEGELEGQGGKFKMPKFGIKIPKIKGPELDSSLSKKDIDVPEVTAEAKLPEAPEIDVTQGNTNVSIPEKGELDGQESKFKMPMLGIKIPKVKGPVINLSSSKKDVHSTLSENKAEVKLPEVELKEHSMEIKSLEKDITTQSTFGSPSKFKMPTFKLPKFGVVGPNVSAEVTDIDNDVKIVGAGINSTGDGYVAATPIIDIDVQSIDNTVIEQDAKGSKFKIPHLSFSMPKAKAPEIGLSLSKKDPTLPDAKAAAELPEASKIPVDMKPPENEADIDGHGSKFKMPKFGFTMPKLIPDIDLNLSKKDIDVTLPEAKEVEVKEPSPKVEIKAPGIDVQTCNVEGSPSKFKMPTFKLHKFGVSTPQDIKVDETDLILPEVKAEVSQTEGDAKLTKSSWTSRFAFSKTSDVPKAEVTLPEAKTDVNLPDIDIKQSLGISIEGVAATDPDASLKKSKFALPKFSFSKQGTKETEYDVSLPDVEVCLPEGNVEVKQSVLELKAPEDDANLDGQESKFKIPNFGISMPKVKGPEIDLRLSKKDVHVTQPEVKAEVQLPDVEVKEPSAKMESKAPGIDVQTSNVEGLSSKFKMSRFGVVTPKVSVKVPDLDEFIKVEESDLSLPEVKPEDKIPDVEKSSWTSRFSFSKTSDVPKADMTLLEAKTDVHLPDIDIKQSSGISIEAGPATDVDASLKKPRFALPKFSFSKQGIKETGGDVSLPDIDLSLPEQNLEVEQPDVDVKTPEGETKLDGQESKFKMPKFGISIPKVKGPEIDLSLLKKDVDVTLPETKAEVQVPDVEVKDHSAKVEMKASGIDIQTSSVEGSSTKFKILKFGSVTPQVSVKVPELDKDIKVDGADLTLSEAKAEVKIPDVEKSSWTSRFSFSKTSDVPKPDLTLPENKTDVHLPDIDIKQSLGISIEGVAATDIDASLKKSRFALPKFSFSKQGTKETEGDISLPDVDLYLPEGNVEVKQPEVELKTPESEAKLDGQDSKFKMPKFGISMPKVKGLEVDLSLTKKDIDVTVPEVKADVQLPDIKVKEPSAKVEMKAPGIDIQTSNVEGLSSKFKLPKFGVATPQVSVMVPELEKDIKVDGADLSLPEAKAEIKIHDVEKSSWTSRFSFSKPSDVPKVDMTLPEAKPDVHLANMDVKQSSSISMEEAPATDSDTSLKKSRFALPKFSFSKQGTKESEVDVSHLDVDVSLPEGNVEVTQPEVEFKAPEGDAKLHGQESKFKLPKFGISMSKVKGPEFDSSLSKKDVDVTLQEAKDEVDVKVKEHSAKVAIKVPRIGTDTKIPEEDLADTECSSTGVKLEGKGNKFKLPNLGFSVPHLKGPEIDLSLLQKDVDVTLPDAKAEIQVPDVEVKEPSAKLKIKAPGIEAPISNVEGSPSRFKMPKFGVATPQVRLKVPDLDKDIKVDGAEFSLPEAKAEVKNPDVEKPSWTSRFSFSKTSAKPIEVDVNLDVPKADMTSTEAKTDAHLPDTDIKQSSGISVEGAPTTDLDGSLKKSRFSLFSFSKQGTKETGGDVSLPDIDLSLSEQNLGVKQPDLDVKTPEGEAKLDGQESKFKMPKFGISMSKVKDIDSSLSKKDADADVTLPEAKAEVQLPDVEVKEPSTRVKFKIPEIDLLKSNVEGSSSKFKIPKFGVAASQVSVKVPDLETDIGARLHGADSTLPESKAEVKIPDVEKPSWTSRFSFSKISAKPIEVDLDVSKVDLTLIETKTDVHLPDTDIKQSSGISIERASAKDLHANSQKSEAKTEVKITAVEIKEPTGSISVLQASTTEGDAKLIKPSWTSRFSFSKTSAKPIEDNVNLDVPKVDVTLPETKTDVHVSDAITRQEAKTEVHLPNVEIKEPPGKVKIKAPGIDVLTSNVEGSSSKFKMPKFGAAAPQVHSVKVSDLDKDIKVDGADLTLSEAKAEVKIPDVEKSSWTSRFAFSKTSVKPIEDDVNLHVQKVDQAKTGTDIKQSLSMSVEGIPATDLDTSLKKSKFSLFSFSKQSTKEPEVSASLPDVEVSLPEGNSEGDVELDKQESKFKMPKFGFSMSSPKKDADNTLPEGNVQLPDVKMEINVPDTEDQTESKPKISRFSFGFGAATPKVSVEVPDDVTAPSIDTDVISEGSGSKFKLPKFGISKKDVTLPSPEAQLPDVEFKEPENVKQSNWFSRWSGGKAPDDINPETPKVDVTSDVDNKGTLVAISMEEPQKSKFSLFSSFSKSSVKETEVIADLPEMEIKSPEPEGSKFKLPKFGIALTKVKGSEVSLDAPQPDIKLEPKEESKSSKMTLTSFGHLFKKTDIEEENLATSKEAVLKSQEAKGMETDNKEDSTKDPERTGWFKW